MVCKFLPDGGFVGTLVMDLNNTLQGTGRAVWKQIKPPLLPVKPSGDPLSIEVDPYHSLIRTEHCSLYMASATEWINARR